MYFSGYWATERVSFVACRFNIIHKVPCSVKTSTPYINGKCTFRRWCILWTHKLHSIGSSAIQPSMILTSIHHNIRSSHETHPTHLIGQKRSDKTSYFVGRGESMRGKDEVISCHLERARREKKADDCTHRPTGVRFSHSLTHVEAVASGGLAIISVET